MRIPASGALSRSVRAESGVAVSRWRAAYAALTVAATLLTLLVISWGGWVRAEGAGLACPDWPLCNGSAVPQPEKLVLIEWGHRLIAGMLGLLVAYVAIGAWRWYRRDRGVLVPATLAGIFVVVQIALGAVTVTADLSPQVVSAHLGTSMLVFAMLIVTSAGANRWPRLVHPVALRAFPLVALFAALLTYGVMLTGSYVVGSGASAACRDWPACDGLPGAGGLVQVHMFHRAAVLLVGAAVLYTAYQARALRRTFRPLYTVAAAGVAIYVLQALVGAGNAVIGVTVPVQVAHLAAAAAMWATMVLLATLAWRAARAEG